MGFVYRDIEFSSKYDYEQFIDMDHIIRDRINVTDKPPSMKKFLLSMPPALFAVKAFYHLTSLWPDVRFKCDLPQDMDASVLIEIRTIPKIAMHFTETDRVAFYSPNVTDDHKCDVIISARPNHVRMETEF
jgi:hypothetical protein